MEAAFAPGQHILVIDDEPTIREVLCEVLTDEGYRVSANDVTFDDLDLVIRLKPDLIILDIVLGDQWTGLVFLERLKDDPRTTQIPILVCTAAGHLTEEINERLRARDCLAVCKPFDLDDLLGEIKGCLAKQEQIPA